MLSLFPLLKKISVSTNPTTASLARNFDPAKKFFLLEFLKKNIKAPSFCLQGGAPLRVLRRVSLPSPKRGRSDHYKKQNQIPRKEDKKVTNRRPIINNK